MERSRFRNNEKIAAKEAIREAPAAYLPTVAINGSIDDNLKVQEQIIPAGLLGDEDVRVAFTKQFSTNASIQLDQTIYDHSLIVGLRANKYKKSRKQNLMPCRMTKNSSTTSA